MGWVDAGDLRPGFRLRRPEGVDAGVTAVASVAVGPTDTYNLEVAATHTYFVGRVGALVHNGAESVFESTVRKPSRIYAIVDQATGDIIYIGKTFQGEEGDVVKRFRGHLGKKPKWRTRDLRPVPLVEGLWTAYETACWEQHFINYCGGLKEHNPASKLENDVNAITKEKYDDFKHGYGHNPCAGRTG